MDICVFKIFNRKKNQNKLEMFLVTGPTFEENVICIIFTTLKKPKIGTQ